jgi:RNA polymerase sigma-70 factor, ECF subfamily
VCSEATWTRTTIDSDTLVERLRESGNQEDWGRVDERYGPLVESFARRLGLDGELARDARQEAMVGFVQAVREGRFDRERGRLRDFLFAIARHKIVDLIRAQARQPRLLDAQTDETSIFDQLPTEDRLATWWEEEWQLGVAAQCLKEARDKFSPETYRMFWLHIVEGMPSGEVARLMGTTVAAVDMATHHVRAFLRQIRPAIEEIF